MCVCIYTHTYTYTHVGRPGPMATRNIPLRRQSWSWCWCNTNGGIWTSRSSYFLFCKLVSPIILLRHRWLQGSGVSTKLTSLHTYFSWSMCRHCSGRKAYRTNFKVWKRRSSTNQRRDLDVWEWVQRERQNSFLVWNPGLGGVGNGNRRESRGLGRADIMERVVLRWP